MSKQLVHRIWLLKIVANLIGVLSVGSFIEFPAYSQTQNQITIPSFRVLQPSGIGIPNIPNISGNVTYPSGSQVYTNGTVQTPNGQIVPPAVTINHGNGSTTYYYPDGSHIDTSGSTIPPVGTFLK